jgi:hypothetical protein
MKLHPLIIFLIIFIPVNVAVPFILATCLPTAFAMLGSIGSSLIVGTILFLVLGKIGKQAQPT